MVDCEMPTASARKGWLRRFATIIFRSTTATDVQEYIARMSL